MAEAQSIQATPKNLPQKIAEVVQESTDTATKRVQDLEIQRRDRFIQGQSKVKIEKRFPPQNSIKVRPLESAQVSPAMMNPQVRSEAKKLQIEHEHKRRMAQNRKAVKVQMKAYRKAPLLFQQISQMPPETQKLTERIQRYRNQYNVTAPESRIQSKIEDKMKNVFEKFSSEKGKKEMAEKASKTITKWIWRGGSDGTVIEWEGITAWIVSFLGVVVWAIRALVTIFKPKSPRWLKLAAFDLKDPATWAVDLPYGIVAIFVLVAIAIIVMLVLIIIIIIIGGLGYLASIIGL